MSFGLQLRGTPRDIAEARARHCIRLGGLSGFETAYPRQLSGGLAQRVGTGADEAAGILMLDEPLVALDAMTKLPRQEELARIRREEKVTMVPVTHDLEEAIFLADWVLVTGKDQRTAPRLLVVNLRRPHGRSEARFVALRKRPMAESALH